MIKEFLSGHGIEMQQRGTIVHVERAKTKVIRNVNSGAVMSRRTDIQGHRGEGKAKTRARNRLN